MTLTQFRKHNSAEQMPENERLLDILQGSSNWMTRTQIAIELGRSSGQLTPYEWQGLRELATDSLIQMSQRTISAGKHEYVYRAIRA